MRVAIPLSIPIAAALAFAAMPALAASPSRCQAYAADAAQAAQQVRKLQCGFDLKDDRWASTDPSPHQRWCLQASDDDVNEEQKERDADVNRCEVCKEYAGGAVAENHDNIKYHCGFTGDRWSSNEQAHFAWCMANASEGHIIIGSFLGGGLRVNILDWEDDERADALTQCYAENRAKIDFCEGYINQTRADVKYVANSQNGCNFKYEDGRYLADDDVRFEWCFNLTSSPGGDPNYKTHGDDPVSFLHEVVTGCQRAARARAALHSPPKRGKAGGGQGFTAGGKSGARDGTLIDRVKRMTPADTPGGGGLRPSAPPNPR